MNQGFQGYKTPSHPSQAPASSQPPSPYFLSCLMLQQQRGEVIFTSSVSPVEVANGDRNGLVASLQQKMNEGGWWLQGEQPGEAVSFPNSPAKCQFWEVSSITGFLDVFLFLNPHWQPGEMMVPPPELLSTAQRRLDSRGFPVKWGVLGFSQLPELGAAGLWQPLLINGGQIYL